MTSEAPQADAHRAAGSRVGVRASTFAAVVRAARPHQWLKNLLVLVVPASLKMSLTSVESVEVEVALVAFCLLSSAVYLLNDIADVESDRKHPTKRFRPIAAGEISIATARTAAFVAVAAGLGLALAIGVVAFGVAVGYFALTSAYSFYLKRIPFVDVLTVAGGFVLRVVAGAVAVSAAPPVWLVVAAGLGAVTISIGKRIAERSKLGADAAAHRQALAWYTPPRSTRLFIVFEWLSIAAAGVWLMGVDEPWMGGLATVAVIVVMERFRRIMTRGNTDDLTTMLVSDRVLLVGALIAVSIVFSGLYL